MAEGYLAWELYNLEARMQRIEQRLDRRILRDTQDPFDLSDDEFIDLYRISPELAINIIEILRPQLQRIRSSGLTVEKQVLAAIRFYAVGCYQRPIAEHWDIAMSQPSVSRCVRNVTNAINNVLLRQTIRFPMTVEERHIARLTFRDANQPFQGAIGALDCTHVAIKAPMDHEEAYVNHHGYHSLNIQMICDPNLKILNVNARYSGARNDAYIWGVSPIHHIMERHYNLGERKTYLIGDQGYPLEPWLMTPLPNEPEGTPRYLYNQQLCSARNCVERLFGVLKSTWRCLSRDRVLQYEPSMSGKIVNACAVLHNMRIEFGIPQNDINQEIIPHEVRNNEENDDDLRRPLTVARRIQNRLIEERFGA